MKKIEMINRIGVLAQEIKNLKAQLEKLECPREDPWTRCRYQSGLNIKDVLLDLVRDVRISQHMPEPFALGDWNSLRRAEALLREEAVSALDDVSAR